MIRKLLFLFTISLCTFVTGQAQSTYLKITLDTKKMHPDYGLGGGGGLAATANKVYAHLGLCTCAIVSNNRDCGSETANSNFCFSQITPYQSEVWQHVVGNWGATALDDGVGQMTSLGSGVYMIEFIVESYFSSAAVSTEITSTSSVPSQPWIASNGGKPYTIGMVFRNENGTLSGRDNTGSDLFVINMTTLPEVVQSGLPEEDYDAITVETHPSTIEEMNYLTSKKAVFPNPFSETVQIKYELNESAKNLSVQIFNPLGQKVADLYGGVQSSGIHQISWNGKDSRGKQQTNGLYIVRITSDNKPVMTERIILYK